MQIIAYCCLLSHALKVLLRIQCSKHLLKHPLVSMKKDVNPKIVSERLGHANVGITLDINSHTDLEIQQESVVKLVKSLKK